MGERVGRELREQIRIRCTYTRNQHIAPYPSADVVQNVYRPALVMTSTPDIVYI